MAFLSNTDFAVSTPSFFQNLTASIGSFFSAVIEARGRQDQIQALEDLSDVELANLGLRREDIVRHVFRDIYYG